MLVRQQDMSLTPTADENTSTCLAWGIHARFSKICVHGHFSRTCLHLPLKTYFSTLKHIKKRAGLVTGDVPNIHNQLKHVCISSIGRTGTILALYLGHRSRKCTKIRFFTDLRKISPPGVFFAITKIVPPLLFPSADPYRPFQNLWFLRVICHKCLGLWHCAVRIERYFWK